MTTDMLWLEVTGRCQLGCGHCYASSGPQGQHSPMPLSEWKDIVDQAADHGVKYLQIIGGEPTLWPDLSGLISHINDKGIETEIYSNLVHVSRDLWDLISERQVRLATSWYTDDPEQHREITGRPTYKRTLTNIRTAVDLGIPIRVGIVRTRDDQRCAQARALLESMGVTDIREDDERLLGRDRAPNPSQLCGHCGRGVAAILPDGRITPCTMSRWMTVGNILDEPLSIVLERLPDAISDVAPTVKACGPNCQPMANCIPWQVCSPRRN